MRTRNLVGVVAVALLGLGGTACGGGGSPVAGAPTTSASAAPPSTTTSPAAAVATSSSTKSVAAEPKATAGGHVRIPSGDRQVVVSVVDARGTGRPLLRIDDRDRIDARGTAVGERTRLSFQSLGQPDVYQIQTVRTRGSEPDCVTARTDGSLTLDACDTRVEGQRFRLTAQAGDPARFTVEAAYGPVAVGDGQVYQDPDQDPWVLTTKDTGSYANVYGDA